MNVNERSDRRLLRVGRGAGTSAIRRAQRHLAPGHYLACDQPWDELTRASVPPDDPRPGVTESDLLAMTVKVIRQRHQRRRADGRSYAVSRIVANSGWKKA